MDVANANHLGAELQRWCSELDEHRKKLSSLLNERTFAMKKDRGQAVVEEFLLSFEVVRFLTVWLQEHILENDKNTLWP